LKIISALPVDLLTHALLYLLTCTLQSSDARKAARYTAGAAVAYSLRRSPSLEGQDNTTAIVAVDGAEAAAAPPPPRGRAHTLL